MDVDVRTEVRDFILGSFLFSDEPSDLEDTVSLLETSVVDSTGILELVMFLEERFKITVSDDEMLPENLDTVDSLVNFIGKKGYSQRD